VSEIGVLTRVKDKQGEELRKYLRSLPRDLFTNLSERTHFARLVVIELSGRPHLLFTSRFDGAAGGYLRSLISDSRALEIWDYCAEPEDVTEASVLAHLMNARSQVAASYVVALTKPAVTVRRINAALALQERLSQFALAAEGMSAVELAQEFWELEPVRDVLET
jgi:hypothetical protein